jgi:hypothetical protein
MFCRIQNPGKTVISYKSNVKEMFFIRQGLVEVYNNENDEAQKDKPILYLPKYSYFGDYQILYNLKSNLVFKTLAHTPEEKKGGSTEQLPDIIFMCCSNEHLTEFCELFPQTAENIKRRSLQRRKKFMQQKDTNSKSFNEKQEKQKREGKEGKDANSDSDSDKASAKNGEEDLEDFYSDEEHENFDSQKEDMKQYLNNLNRRIDVLVDALKQADSMMARMGDQKGIIEQINLKKNAKGKGNGAVNANERKSIAEFFKETISNSKQQNK